MRSGAPEGDTNVQRKAVPVGERWDAGEIGCGRLASELKARVDRLAPGECLEITIQDPGAKADLPAWCRLTGHTLLSAEHPVYVICRKPD